MYLVHKNTILLVMGRVTPEDMGIVRSIELKVVLVMDPDLIFPQRKEVCLLAMDLALVSSREGLEMA